MTQPAEEPTAAIVSIAKLLKTHTLQFDADPMTADRSLLDRTRALLTAEIDRAPLTTDLVHLAQKLYWVLDDPESLAGILARYLQQPLPVEEEAWARWEYVDSLALLGRSEEVVKQQKRYLAWARKQWKVGMLSSQQLLQVMSDSTQAEQWRLMGRTDEWLAIFDDLMASVPPTPDDRMERFYTLRTACYMLERSEKYPAALAMVERIGALAEEDPDWPAAYEMPIQAGQAAIRIFAAQGDMEAVRQIGMHVTTQLEERWQRMESLSESERTRLVIQYDNIAGPLFRARQYDLSIPLHRRCLELGYSLEFVYLWLAASIWVTTRNRAEVLELLRQGAARARRADDYRDDFLAQPEFQDVREAPDFLQAVTANGGN